MGINFCTATNRLRKQVMFRLAKKVGENTCFRCGLEITSVDDFSVDHKLPWMDISPELFWDIGNIGFSHLGCNIRCARQPNKKYPSKLERRRARHQREKSDLVKHKQQLERSKKSRIRRATIPTAEEVALKATKVSVQI